MAITYIDFPPATAGQTDFEFTFPYLEDEHVKVEINGVNTTAFTISTTPTTKVVLNAPGATAGDQVRVRRRSAPNQNLVDFVNGSVLTESELDLAYRHNRYLSEEIAELNDQSLQLEAGGTQWDAKGLRLKNVGTATATTDAVTKVYVDNKVAQVSSGATQPPLKWQFTGLAGANGTYTVTGAEVNGDTAYEVSIDGLLQEPGVDFTVNPNTDTLTIVPNISAGADIVVIQRGFGVAVAGTVGTNSLVDGSVTNPKLAANVITSDKISTTDTKFNVQSDGKVGIGTASPGAKLHIEDTNANLPGIRISASDQDYEHDIRAQGDGILISADSTNYGEEGPDIRFKVSGSEHMRIRKNGRVGIGTTIPAHALDVVGDVNITGNYKVGGTNLQTVPTGTVSAFAGSAAPTGYLLCDGSSVNRTTYAALAAVLEDPATPGTYIYGSVDSNTFNLPDLRGRVVAGLDNMGGSSANRLTDPASTTNSIDGDGLGNTGGHETHQLTEAEMPSHSHTYTKPLYQFLVPGGPGLYSHSSDPNAQTSNTGSDQAHNNVQPTIILNYIIKI